MAGSLNKVTLIGNLGRDPEIRTMQNNNKVASFSIATSDSWRDKATGEKKERTEWHRIAIFNEGLIGIVEQYVHRGSKIYIEGELRTRKWTDQGGQERYTTEIVIQGFRGQLILLDAKRSDGPPAPTQEEQFTKNGHDLDDDIPF